MQDLCTPRLAAGPVLARGSRERFFGGGFMKSSIRRAFITPILCLLGAAPVAAGEIHMSVAANGVVVLSNLRGSANADLKFDERFDAWVAASAARHQLPEALLHAVIMTESSYNPRALSPAGAAGLMQLMPSTARDMGVKDVWDPADNIEGGARYLRRLIDLFDNDLVLALAAYNAGPAAVRAQGQGIPENTETQRYVPAVMERYRHLDATADTGSAVW